MGFDEPDVKNLPLLSRVFGVGTDQTGQYMDSEPALRHAPLIINESGSNANTKTTSTKREKPQDKLVFDGKKSPMSKREDATRYSSACVRLSYLAQDSLGLAKTAKHFAQTMGEPREIDFIKLKRAARYLVGKPKAAFEFPNIESGEKARRDWRLRFAIAL